MDSSGVGQRNSSVQTRSSRLVFLLMNVLFLPVRPTVSRVRCFVHLLLGLQKDATRRSFSQSSSHSTYVRLEKAKRFWGETARTAKCNQLLKSRTEAEWNRLAALLSGFTVRKPAVEERARDVRNLEVSFRWVGDASRGLPGSQVGRRWTRTNEWKECEAGCVGCGRRSALPTATPRCRHSAGIPFTGGMFRHEIKKKKTQLFTDCSAPSQDVLSVAALAARPNQTSCKHLKATVKRLGR